MYGYIRPKQRELRLREYQQFRAAYCGLCEVLRREFGIPARFLVNYDLTFLAMILSPGTTVEMRRCPAHPLRKRPCICASPALLTAADYSVILAWWKAKDDLADEKGGRRLLAGAESAMLKRAYEKASARRGAFDRNTEECMKELDRLEKEANPSLDRAADCFARILAYAAEDTASESDRRIQRELLYHVGRSVYILDAIDDLPGDVKKGRYNPLRYRFDLAAGSLSKSDKQELHATLNLSQHSAVTALELRTADVWQPILENILIEGLPSVTEMVLSGQWKERKKRHKTPQIFDEREEPA